VIFRTLGAPPRGGRPRRPKRVSAEESAPEPVAVTRATVVAATGFESEADAEAWLERCRSAEDVREQLVSAAVGTVNRAVHGHRVAAGDPYVREVVRAHARRVRIGYGVGDDLVEGRWRAAYTLPAPKQRSRRRQALEPQHELAGMLAGRRPVWTSEDLALRARLDLDHGRLAQSALQLEAALTAFEAELESDSEAGRFTPPRDGRSRVHDLAAAALRRPLDEEQRAELERTLSDVERALRRRRFAAGNQ
jgi:hypothetical protein